MGWVGLDERLLLEKLRGKYRTGWKTRLPEICWEDARSHSLKLACAARIFAQHHAGYDARLAFNYGLIEDISDIISPDRIPGEVSDDVKFAEEHSAVLLVCSSILGGGQRVVGLWERYKLRSDPEAQLVWQLDKMEPVVQSIVVRKYGDYVNEFYQHARPKVSLPALRSVLDEMVRVLPTRPYPHYFGLLRA